MRPLIYNPPRVPFPGRAGGGTRGGVPSGGPETPGTYVLAPEHTGLTTRDQVALYWFLSGPASVPVEVTVVRPGQPKPLREIMVDPPVSAGIHRTRLADHGVRLKPGVVYSWSVAVVTDPARRSKDILSRGTIQLIEQSPDLRRRLAKAVGLQVPAAYAEAGIWYDSLDSLSILIDADPTNAHLKAARASLLEQVKLDDVARYEGSRR